MKTTIDIRCENGVWADLRITNTGDTAVRIHNPGNYRPTEGWEFSYEAYRVAALRSFHSLKMTLRTKDGSVVEPADVSTFADHIVGLPVELEPGAELLISVPLHEFYDLDRNADYSLALTYGDDNARVSAATQFRCPAPAGPAGLRREGPGA
jgi:hypothetical protein